MTTLPQTRTRKAPQFRSRLTELRSLSHSVAHDLGLCPEARRNVLYALSGSRYARDLSETQLEIVVGWMRSRLEERRPPLEATSDDEALAVLGVYA